MVIYPVDSIIHFSNNRGQVFSDGVFNSVYNTPLSIIIKGHEFTYLRAVGFCLVSLFLIYFIEVRLFSTCNKHFYNPNKNQLSDYILTSS